MTTNGKRNRSAGHKWERKCVHEFIRIGFPHVVTSRSENRSRDAAKIDLVNKDELVNGVLPYSIQCKTLSTAAPYPKLLSEMGDIAGAIKVVLHKQTKKSEGGKFVESGRYACLYMDDLLNLIEENNKLRMELVNLQSKKK